MIELREYTIKTTLGTLGDMETEYWDKKDWEEWGKKVEEMKKKGTYGKKVETTFNVMPNTPFEDPINNSILKESYKCVILDINN